MTRKLKTIATRLVGVVMAATFALSVPVNAMADNSSIITVGNETYTIGSYSGTDPDSNAIWRSVDTYYNTENKYTPSFHTLTNSSGEQWPVFCIQLGSDGPVATSTAGQNYKAKTDDIDSENIQNSIIARQVSYKVIENGFYSTEYWKSVGLTVKKNNETLTYTYTDDQVRTATQLAIWIAESVVGGGNFYLYYNSDNTICYAPASIQSAMGNGSDYVVMEVSDINTSSLPNRFAKGTSDSTLKRYVYQRTTPAKATIGEKGDYKTVDIQYGTYKTTVDKSKTKTSYYANEYDNGMYELVFELAAMGLASTDEQYFNLYGMSKTQVLKDSNIYVANYSAADKVEYGIDKPETDIVLKANDKNDVTAINGTPVYDENSVTTSVKAAEVACDTAGYTEIQFTVSGQGFNGGYRGKFENLPDGATVSINGVNTTLTTSSKYTYFQSTLGSGNNYIHTTRSGVSKGAYSEVVTVKFPTKNYGDKITLTVNPKDDRSDDDQIYLTTSNSSVSIKSKPQVMVTPDVKDTTSVEQMELPLGKGSSSDTITISSNILFGDYSGQFSSFTGKDGSDENQAPTTESAATSSKYNPDNYVWLTNSSGVYVSNDASNPSAGFTQGTDTTDLYVNFSVTKNIGYNTLTSVTVDFVAIGFLHAGSPHAHNLRMAH